MNQLEKFISDNWLSEVTWNIFKLQKDAGLYVRVLHNTTTGQAIFLKWFKKYNNFMISVNPTTKDSNDWFYINQYDKDWVIVEAFEDSLTNFKSKPASLWHWAIEV